MKKEPSTRFDGGWSIVASATPSWISWLSVMAAAYLIWHSWVVTYEPSSQGSAGLAWANTPSGLV